MTKFKSIIIILFIIFIFNVSSCAVNININQSNTESSSNQTTSSSITTIDVYNLKVTVLSNDVVRGKYEAGDDFFFIVGRSNCVNCTDYYPALNSYYDQLNLNNNFNNGVQIYYLDVTKIDGIYVDDTVTVDTYIYWYDEIYEGTNTDLKGTRTGFATPTTIFVKDGKVVYALEGVRTVDQLSSYVNAFINE